MKRLVLSFLAVLLVTAAAAPSAQAVCFHFVDFCDSLVANFVGPNQGSWYHFDCATDSPLDVSPRGNYISNCGTNGTRILRSNPGNGPGAFYFIIDTPLDGDLDMLQGVYPNGSCWIPNRKYDLNNVCKGTEGQGRSSVP